MIIDAHVHLHGSVYAGDSQRTGADEVLKAMDRAGIQKAVVQGLNPAENQEILTECSLHRDRLIPFVLETPESLAGSDLEAHVSSGARGIGEIYVSPGSKQTLSDFLEPVIAVARDLSLPVLLHTGEFSYTAPMIAVDTIRDNPDVTFILGHMGSLAYVLDTIEILKTFPNAYADTSGLTSTPILRRAVMECGPEKLLFASDYPFWDPVVELERIYVANLGADTEQLLLGENAARLFNL